MFPAYSESKEKQIDNNSIPINFEDIGISNSIVSTQTQWLYNKSFVSQKNELDTDKSSSESEISLEIKRSLNSSQSSKKHKKHKDKKKKKKKEHKNECLLSDKNNDITSSHRKKQKKIYDSTPEDLNIRIDEKNTNNEIILNQEKNLGSNYKWLIDENYQIFFSKIPKDTLKKAHFFEDIPGLSYRNAFRIDLIGDKNNLCFDSVYEKYLPTYQIPKAEIHQQLKNKQISTRKQIKQQIRESKKSRYFTNKLEIEAQTSNFKASKQSFLSNKMRFCLEMKREIEEDEESDIKTVEIITYLQDNPKDVSKWLEFINCQNSIKTNQQYERKSSIFEKAIKENQRNFRLRIELLKYKADLYEIVGIPLEDIENDFLSMILFKEDSASDEQALANQFETWFEFFKFLVKSNSPHLSFEKIRRIFLRCFDFFLNDSNIKKSLFFYENIIQVLDVYCSFLKSAGYIEKSIGVYQAVLDFNFCICKNANSQYMNADFKSKKILFELYWDIGLPKFGEKFSNGWINCLENRDNLFEKIDQDLYTNSQRFDDYLDIVEDQILFQKNIRIEYRWLDLENLRSFFNWYPFYPKTITGESADDCIDPDRLISFEEDISFALFDTTMLKNRDASEFLKFKILCKFFNQLNLFDWEQETLDPIKTSTTIYSYFNNSFDDREYVWYLGQKLSFFDDISTERQNFFKNSMNEILSLSNKESFKNLDEINKLKTLEAFKQSNKVLIDYIRNVFDQSINSFSSIKFKTNVTLLKWKFEINLILILAEQERDLPELISCDENYLSYFNAKTIMQNLLAQTKVDLALEHNRSNFEIWKQYGILKWILSHKQFKEFSKKTIKISTLNSIKETRKIFETLLTTSESTSFKKTQHFIDIYSLTVDLVLLELGIFYKQFDIETTSLNSYEATVQLSSINVQEGLFDLNNLDLSFKTDKAFNNSINSTKAKLSEFIIKNCLNKKVEYQLSKSKSTFKIDMSNSTRLLLTKKDFQNEYYQIRAECEKCSEYSCNKHEDSYLIQKKLFYYNQVYSLFFLCLNEIDNLIELNEELLNNNSFSNLFKSKVIEFYLVILNYICFVESKISKHAFRMKLAAIFRLIISNKRIYQTPCKSLLRIIYISFIRLKLDSARLFCNQLIESNDIDIFLGKIGKCQRFGSAANISLIYTYVHKLNQVLRLNSSIKNEIRDTYATNLGIHYKIRRLFEEALKENPQSVQLWILYLKFEISYTNCSNDRILYVYYQSIKSLPFCKTLYKLAVEFLPEKYNEIMKLLYTKEIRTYLPIQELNILLEPIKNRNEIFNEKEEEEDNYEKMNNDSGSSKSFTSLIESSSNSLQTSEDEDNLTDSDK